MLKAFLFIGTTLSLLYYFISLFHMEKKTSTTAKLLQTKNYSYQIRVGLGSIYFIEIEIFLLEIL